MNVYGPRQDYHGAYIAVIMKMLDAIDRGESPTIMGDGSEAFDFVAVEDCGLANVCAMKADSCRQLLQRRHRQAHLAQGAGRDAARVTGSNKPINYAPRSQATLVRNRIGSPKKASEEIGFTAAIDLRRGPQAPDRLAGCAQGRGRGTPQVGGAVRHERSSADSTYRSRAPRCSEEEIQSVLAPLRSGWLVQGPKVREFEQKWSEFTGAKHSIAVTSCTTALELALAALGFGPGDEAIVPAFTWIATANAVEHLGGKVVFCDIDLETFNLDVADAARRITPRTRAILPVHLFGLAADMEAVNRLAERHGLWVIEDAACGFGSRIQGRHVGTWATPAASASTRARRSRRAKAA